MKPLRVGGAKRKSQSKQKSEKASDVPDDIQEQIDELFTKSRREIIPVSTQRTAAKPEVFPRVDMTSIDVSGATRAKHSLDEEVKKLRDIYRKIASGYPNAMQVQWFKEHLCGGKPAYHIGGRQSGRTTTMLAILVYEARRLRHPDERIGLVARTQRYAEKLQARLVYLGFGEEAGKIIPCAPDRPGETPRALTYSVDKVRGCTEDHSVTDP